MPKPSRFPNHPIRVLRKELGFSSAAQFAKFVGIPVESIRKAELGDRPVKHRAATQIGTATGVLHTWLMTPGEAKGPPIDPNGNPLTKEGFDAYAGHSPMQEDQARFDAAIRMHLDRIECLLKAAVPRRRFPACLYFLSIAFRQALEQFNLEPGTQEELNKLDANPGLGFIKLETGSYPYNGSPIKFTITRPKTKRPSRRRQKARSSKK